MQKFTVHFMGVGLFLSLVGLLGCGNQQTVTVTTPNVTVTSPAVTVTIPAATTTTPSNDVVMKINIETNGTRKPKVVGETNLPDETQLMVTVEGKTVKYTGQDKITVKNGKFESTTFSSNGNDFEPGQYVARVTMPIPSVQPQSVRAVIGENGENLKGQLVKRDDIGVTVSSEQPFQI